MTFLAADQLQITSEKYEEMVVPVGTTGSLEAQGIIRSGPQSLGYNLFLSKGLQITTMFQGPAPVLRLGIQSWRSVRLPPQGAHSLLEEADKTELNRMPGNDAGRLSVRATFK